MNGIFLAVLSNYQSDFVIIMCIDKAYIFIYFFVQLIFVSVEQIQTKHYGTFLCFHAFYWNVSVVPGIARYNDNNVTMTTTLQ